MRRLVVLVILLLCVSCAAKQSGSVRDFFLGPPQDDMTGGEAGHRYQKSTTKPDGSEEYESATSYSKGADFQGANAEELEGGSASADQKGAKAGEFEKEGFEPPKLEAANPLTWLYYGGMGLMVVGLVLIGWLKQYVIGGWVFAAGAFCFGVTFVFDQYGWLALIAIVLLLGLGGYLVYKKIKGDSAASLADLFQGGFNDVVAGIQKVRNMAKRGVFGEDGLNRMDEALASKEDKSTEDLVAEVKKEHNI